MAWLDEQTNATVYEWESLPHVMLNEHTGEMRCNLCGESKFTRKHTGQLTTFMIQQEDFNRFAEHHLHDVVIGGAS